MCIFLLKSVRSNNNVVRVRNGHDDAIRHPNERRTSLRTIRPSPMKVPTMGHTSLHTIRPIPMNKDDTTKTNNILPKVCRTRGRTIRPKNTKVNPC